MITVMGATGHTGNKIATALLAAGEKVRALGRSDAKLKPLAEAGAEVRSGDALDTEHLTEAFRGAGAVYTLVAPDPTAPDYRASQDALGESIAQAVRTSGVRHVVALSSLGGELTEGTGVIVGLHAQEERLKEIPNVNVLFLRPVSFFENVFERLPLIKQAGINGDSIAPDLAIPLVATRDIADAAVRALRARDWTGIAVRELLGPREYTMVEITRMIGERIGRPDLGYVPFPDDEMAGALVQAGLSASFARLYTEMTRAFHTGIIQGRHGRTRDNTTPTQFEDFAEELAQAYRAM